MSSKIQLRRDTAANWTATNPVLAQGEPGLEIDTKKVKYGDGTTAWNLLDYAAGGSGSGGDFNTGFEDGVDDHTYHFVNKTGKKEFTFETEGNKYFEITLSSAQVADIGNTGNLTFNVAETPQIADVWLTYTRGNNIEFHMKADWDLGNFTSWYTGLTEVSPGIYTTPAPVPFVAGDKIVCKYWSEGTTYIGSYYDNYSAYYPTASEPSATNTVTIDLTYNNWLGDGTAGTAKYDLLDPTIVDKHDIVFYNNNTNFRDKRNITAVLDNGDGTGTITFDGAPYQSKAIDTATFSYTAVDTVGDGNQVQIAHDAYPTFATECIYPYDVPSSTVPNFPMSGTLTINGGSPVVFMYWFNNNSSNGNFYIQTRDVNVSYNQGDTIEITFYRHMTMIELDIYRPGNAQNNWNNGYKWFDWREDLGVEYTNGPGNGVMGGTGQLLLKIFKEPNLGNQSSDVASLVQQFGWTGEGNYQQSPRDPYTNNNVSNWGTQTYGCYPMYDFGPRGIVFYSNYTDNDWSRTIKVRIIYKFDLIIADEVNYWFYC